jgi:hypothetical protein
MQAPCSDGDAQGTSGLRGLLVPPPSSCTFTELVCNRTFDKYSCWPDTPPNTTANISCPWYLPWYHKGNSGRPGRLRGWSLGVG